MMVLVDLSVWLFPRYARKKPHKAKESTALPKAQHAKCVSPKIMGI